MFTRSNIVWICELFDTSLGEYSRWEGTRQLTNQKSHTASSNRLVQWLSSCSLLREVQPCCPLSYIPLTCQFWSRSCSVHIFHLISLNQSKNVKCSDELNATKLLDCELRYIPSWTDFGAVSFSISLNYFDFKQVNVSTEAEKYWYHLWWN